MKLLHVRMTCFSCNVSFNEIKAFTLRYSSIVILRFPCFLANIVHQAQSTRHHRLQRTRKSTALALKTKNGQKRTERDRTNTNPTRTNPPKIRTKTVTGVTRKKTSLDIALVVTRRNIEIRTNTETKNARKMAREETKMKREVGVYFK